MVSVEIRTYESGKLIGKASGKLFDVKISAKGFLILLVFVRGKLTAMANTAHTTHEAHILEDKTPIDRAIENYRDYQITSV